ncbi:MAG: alpha/beta hydrolase [Nitrococcus mobilis]|nr:alpha/beta hydrolase [Nitrococcus mobilis]
MSTSVYFAHGKESGPWGYKVTALAERARRRGLAVESPDFRFTYNADERVRYLLSLNPPMGNTLVLVGSSMGGYVTTVASRTLNPLGLFLIAPALLMPGYQVDTPPRANLVEIVHGWADDVIPIEHSWRFAQQHRARLHVLDGDHTLNAHLPLLERLFETFLDELQL